MSRSSLTLFLCLSSVKKKRHTCHSPSFSSLLLFGNHLCSNYCFCDYRFLRFLLYTSLSASKKVPLCKRDVFGVLFLWRFVGFCIAIHTLRDLRQRLIVERTSVLLHTHTPWLLDKPASQRGRCFSGGLHGWGVIVAFEGRQRRLDARCPAIQKEEDSLIFYFLE